MPAAKRTPAPTAEPIPRSLPLLLLQAREAVMDHFRPLLREHGVSEQQWRVIRALKSEGLLEMGRLAELCSLHGPSLTGMLGRMEQAGYVSRARRPEDQRVVVVAMCPAAERLFEAMREGMQAQYRLLEQKLGRQDLARLYDTLDELVEKLRA